MISRDTAAPRMMMLPVLYHGSYPSDLSFSETVVTFRSAGVFRHIPLDGVFAPPGESSSTAAAFYYDSRVITWSTWQTFLPLFVIPLSIVIRPSSPLIKTQFLIRPRGGHGIERTFLAPSSLSVFIISTSGKGEGVKEEEEEERFPQQVGPSPEERGIPNTGFLAGITDIHG